MQTPKNRKASNDKYYAANRRKVQALNQANKIRNIEYVKGLKQNIPCVDCGINYPHYVMDFDHVSDSKVRDISNLARRGCSLTTLDKEIAKCELVCANCHRKRTHQRLQSIAVDVPAS